jgi:hypothetical protein
MRCGLEVIGVQVVEDGGEHLLTHLRQLHHRVRIGARAGRAEAMRKESVGAEIGASREHDGAVSRERLAVHSEGHVAVSAIVQRHLEVEREEC